MKNAVNALKNVLLIPASFFLKNFSKCFVYGEKVNKTGMLPFYNTVLNMILGVKRLPGYREL